MDQNTKIILGIVLLGGAYYLYTRKKPETVVNKRIGEVDSGYKVKVMDSSNLPKWRLKRDIINGVIPDGTGGRGIVASRQNVLFRKGDIIQGNIETRFIFNKNNQGISALPTVSGAYFEASPFVLLDDLEEVR